MVSQKEIRSINLNLEIFIPENHFSQDYQDYFASWLIRHGCVVLANYHKDKPRVMMINERRIVPNGDDYFKYLELCFRKDVAGQ